MKLISRVQFFATPWTVAHKAPPSMEFSRQEYWSELTFPSPGDHPDLGIEPRSPALQADALPSEPPGKPPYTTSDCILTFLIDMSFNNNLPWYFCRRRHHREDLSNRFLFSKWAKKAQKDTQGPNDWGKRIIWSTFSVSHFFISPWAPVLLP